MSEKPYHAFSRRRKWCVVVMIGVAGMFSGLSSNIYSPALDAIAQVGISPLFWGSLSDTRGRRQIYIYSFMVYIIANIVLSFSPNFIVLVIFRALQAAGSASTVSIGNGVIQDITSPAERGGFMCFYQGTRSFSIAIGPVLGGLLANYFGFRSIFVFLTVLAGMVTIGIALLLPETQRSIAGDGTVRLKGIHKPLVWTLTKEPPYLKDRDEPYQPPSITIKTFLSPLFFLKEKDVLLSLVFGGVVYAIWSMVTSSTTGIFKHTFHLNEIQLGLAFIPNGLGAIFGPFIIGKLTNTSFAEVEQTYKERHGLPDTHSISKETFPIDFPIEQARLRHIRWVIPLFIISTLLYGFSVQFPSFTSRPGWIAVPLVLHFLIASTSNAVLAINSTLISDLCPGKGASSTAINNLVRCSFGAIGVAFIEQLIAAVGGGTAFLGLALIAVVATPLVAVQWYCGSDWRRARMDVQSEAK
ncbi:major facilitator superfamily domain-containing protein [Lophiotrema nucula]|uniref:Major facilitator superfamily domain-containing protein n=1 Tax=Lophiotrema nucula TaxID=690887 RepID=A0A6A5YFQ9_9PLEO|nr:major facilitator superfamily domain-containing protein [Lophiotrema nucula]